MEHLIFELGLAITLMGLAALLARRLKLSVVPFLIIIGLSMGPHMPHVGPLDFRFIESEEIIHFMGRMGILFLLFSLGLEFSLGRLVRAGQSIAVASGIYIAINLTLGLIFGWSLGFPAQEILIIAGVTTISSSAIVAKVIIDLRRSANPETNLILGIIMGEDIFLATYLAVVSGVVLQGSTSILGILASVGVALAFVLAILTVGRLLAPRVRNWISTLPDEPVLLAVFALLFLVAGFGESIGVGEAIGALLIGLFMAETGHGKRIQRLAVPFRDFFGAFLFFSFGLSIDPFSLPGAIAMAVGAAALTIAGNLAAGIIVGAISRLPPAAGVNIGLTIISRGEFSIVMASLAATGRLMEVIQPFTALYVLILSVLGPVLTKESARIYARGEQLLAFSRIIRGQKPGADEIAHSDTGHDSSDARHSGATDPETDNDQVEKPRSTSDSAQHENQP